MSLTRSDVDHPAAPDNVVAFPNSLTQPSAPGVTVFYAGRPTRYETTASYERAILDWAREQLDPPTAAPTMPTGDQVLVIHAGERRLYSSPEAFALQIEAVRADRRYAAAKARLALMTQRMVVLLAVAVFTLGAVVIVSPPR